MENCKKCGRYVLDGELCNCKKYEIYEREYRGDDPKIIYTRSIKNAMEQYASDSYWEDPCDPSDWSCDLECEGKKYRVTGEAVVDFHVGEV